MIDTSFGPQMRLGPSKVWISQMYGFEGALLALLPLASQVPRDWALLEAPASSIVVPCGPRIGELD